MAPVEYVPSAVIHLTPAMFGEAERTLAECGGIRVTAFRYSSGVAALRVASERVETVWLPFRGQQIWRYAVDGDEQTMRTHFDEPARSAVFAETYGGFLLHCGLTGIGHPSPSDTHLQHGELPNAEFDSARLLMGRSDAGAWVGMTGDFRYRSTHGADVTFTPFVALRPGGTALDLDLSITNHRRTPFAYSYLCHVNWRIIDGARLVQTARLDAEHFELAPAASQDEATAAYTDAIARDPEAGTVLSLAQPVVPEYCAILRPDADADGWAHFLMVGPDGRAASVSYETEHLPLVIRWISNTGDEFCAGFCLPTTAHHRGRLAAERDGMMREVPPGGSVRMRLEVDVLSPEATVQRVAVIDGVNTR